MFEPEDEQRLLAIARRSLEARVRRMETAPPDGGGALDVPRGAFVSIHRGAQLRGCLGRLEADQPLCRVVAHLAGAVSDSDPRFEPVAERELGHLQIEISVLMPARQVFAPDEIEIGRDGLIVECGRRRGLLLPQVATQYGWDVLTFLQHTALKAGLSGDQWQQGAKIYAFEARVFGEVT